MGVAFKSPFMRPRQLLDEARARLPKSLLTYFLFCVFGIGSWVAVNGVWAEVSVLVLTLPECEKVPAALVVVIQLANVGTLLYTVVRCVFGCLKWPRYYLEVSTVFLLVTVGLISCVLLSLFWSVTTEVSGDPHSVAMFLLTFLLAAVDCTSSVVFLPFMKHFPKEYVSALYIGEGLSGLVPSVVGLSQGFANNSISCIKEYPGHNELGINFSPSIYFAFLAGMMAVCGAAFVLIVTLPCTREQRRHQDAAEEITSSTSANSEGEGDTSEESRCEGTRTVARKMEESESNGTLTADENAEEKEKECLSSDDQSPLVTPASRRARMRRFHVAQCTKLQSKCPTLASLLSILWDNLSLLLCIAALNFLTNGALSAVSSYAFIPYGNLVYHLGVNLGILANPVACLFYTFVPFRHRALGAVLTALAWLLGIFVLVMAFLFPNPLLSGNSIGGAIMVAVNVAISLLVSYAKVGMVVQLHSYHGNQDAALLMGGVATQLGSLAGAVLFFFIVYFTDAFS